MPELLVREFQVFRELDPPLRATHLGSATAEAWRARAEWCVANLRSWTY